MSKLRDRRHFRPFTQGIRASGTHLIGYRVGTTLGLDNVEVRGWKSSYASRSRREGPKTQQGTDHFE